MSIVPREKRDPVADAEVEMGVVGMEPQEENTVKFSEEMKVCKIVKENSIREIETVEMPAVDGGFEQAQKTDNEQQK